MVIKGGNRRQIGLSFLFRYCRTLFSVLMKPPYNLCVSSAPSVLWRRRGGGGNNLCHSSLCYYCYCCCSCTCRNCYFVSDSLSWYSRNDSYGWEQFVEDSRLFYEHTKFLIFNGSPKILSKSVHQINGRVKQTHGVNRDFLFFKK